MHTTGPDIISFAVEENEDEGFTGRTVTPVINGVSLIELARIAEAPAAEADGQLELAGSYAGWLIRDDIEWPRHFLNGDPDASWFGKGDTSVLGCECLCPGCWDLTTIISLGETITWSTFRMGHRNWDLSALGPFTFDRAQYLQALADASGIPVAALASSADRR